MYVFEAKYDDLSNGKEKVIVIQIPDNVVNCSEKEIYMAAIDEAYENQTRTLPFVSLSLVSC